MLENGLFEEIAPVGFVNALPQALWIIFKLRQTIDNLLERCVAKESEVLRQFFICVNFFEGCLTVIDYF